MQGVAARPGLRPRPAVRGRLARVLLLLCLGNEEASTEMRIFRQTADLCDEDRRRQVVRPLASGDGGRPAFAGVAVRRHEPVVATAYPLRSLVGATVAALTLALGLGTVAVAVSVHAGLLSARSWWRSGG